MNKISSFVCLLLLPVTAIACAGVESRRTMTEAEYEELIEYENNNTIDEQRTKQNYYSALKACAECNKDGSAEFKVIKAVYLKCTVSSDSHPNWSMIFRQ